MSIKKTICNKIGNSLTKLLAYSDKPPYQSFWYNGTFIEGKVDTVRMYNSLAISPDVKGKSLLDLGCNEGSICLQAAQDGASKVVGVEFNESTYQTAKTRANEANLDVEYVLGEVVEYLEKAETFDFIMLLAMVRHIHRALMAKEGHDVSASGRPYLVYNSYQTLILGEDSPVKDTFDDILKMCIDKSRSYFICSINDFAGLILRRQDETKKYFKGLSERIEDIEIYNFSPLQPEYTIIRMKLK